MRIWQCDRCKKVYEKNDNQVLQELIQPIFKSHDFERSASYVKIVSKTESTETILYDLCDDCMNHLCRWLKREV